jgi:hypothetical protein
MGFALFTAVAGIDNDQTYSFLNYATTALMFMLLYVLFLIASHVPVSPRPEKAFRRLLARFFNSCVVVIETMGNYPYRPMSKAEQRRMAFHVQEISTLPTKLNGWTRAVAGRGLEGTGPEQLQALIMRLRTLSRAVRSLLEVRSRRQSPAVSEALRDDIRAWRVGVQSVVQGLARDPAYADSAALRARVDTVMAELEEKVTAMLNAARPGEIGEDEAESLFRLLGAYRGVSEAIVDFAGSAGEIPWAPWHEERFA